MKIQVQIVLYRVEALQLEAFFRSLRFAIEHAKKNHPLYDFALKIAINESQRSKENVAKQASKIVRLDDQNQIFLFEENIGFASANNFMASASPHCDYILFLNSDGLMDLMTISLLIEFIESHPGCGAVEAKQVPFSHPKVFRMPNCETDWISFACALVRKDLFESLGGFDERFFLYCEDVDISWRIRREGYTVNTCFQSKFFHDKRIGNNGFIEISKAEQEFGVLSALLLAHKYGLRRKMKAMIRDLKSSKSDLHAEILKRFYESIKVTEASEAIVPSKIPKSTWKFASTFYD